MPYVDFNDKDFEGGDFAPIPEDWYPLRVHDTNYRPSSAGNEMIEIQFAVFGPKYANRRLWHYAVVRNFGFKAMIEAMMPNCKGIQLPEVMGDKKNPVPVEALHGMECEGFVTIEKGTEEYPDDKNRITKFRVAEGKQPAGVPQGQGQSQKMPDGLDDVPW